MSVIPSPARPLSLLVVLCLAGCGSSPQTYVDRGKKYFADGKYDDAAIQFEKAIQKSSQLGEAHYQLGLVDLKRGQIVPGYRELLLALRLMPRTRDLTAVFGQVAMTLYNADPQHPRQLYDQASSSAVELLQANAEDFDGNLLKGALALQDKNPAEAIAYFRKSADAKQSDLNPKLGMAEAYVQDGQDAAAISLMRDVVQKNPSFGPGYDFLFQRYRTSGRMDEAENVLKQKVASNPNDLSYRLELARHFATERKVAEMNDTIRKIVERPADFPDGQRTAGDFYASLAQPDDALRHYEAGLVNAKDKITYRKRMVRMLAFERKWPEAAEQLKAILKEKPDDTESKLVQALVWLDEGKPENLDHAIAELRLQSEARPEDPMTHFQLGNALARKNDADGARREWTAAAQRSRGYLPPRLALIQLHLSQGRPADGLTIADELMTIAPDDPQVRLVHAICLIGVARFSDARLEIKRLMTQYPKEAQVRFRLGVLALAEKKYKEAEDVFQQLRAGGANDLQILTGLAQAYAGQHEVARGEQLLLDEIRRSPNSAPARLELGRFAMGAGRYDVAIEQYRTLAGMAPASKEIQLALARAYTASGDLNSAVTILQKAVQADPKNANVMLELSQALAASGRLDEAKAQYRSLLATQPNNPNALNDLAFLMAESGENLDQALLLAQRGEQNAVSPDLKLSATDTLGWIYYKKRMDDNALQTFQILVRRSPDNPVFRYHLGATLLQKGDREKARTELEAALAARPGPTDAPKIRQLLARL